MKVPAARLPDDPSDLRNLVEMQRGEIALLHEQVRLLKGRLFGRGSEKNLGRLETQPELFESEEADETADEDVLQEVKSHKRKTKRDSCISEDLPCDEVVVDVGEDEKRCECGCLRNKIGEETNVVVNYKRAEIHVTKYIRPKYS